MHTVFTTWCTGCGLCVPVCPTDCIALPVSTQPQPSAADNVVRYVRRTARLDGRHTLRRVPALIEVDAEQERLRAAVLAAVARKRGAP
jgi:electron transport complex protein RnfB